MAERRLSMLHGATLLTRSGLHGYGINHRRTWIKLHFRGIEPALELALASTGKSTYRDAVSELLSGVGGKVVVEELKPPQPLPEGGRRAEPTPATASPLGLLIRFL